MAAEALTWFELSLVDYGTPVIFTTEWEWEPEGPPVAKGTLGTMEENQLDGMADALMVRARDLETAEDFDVYVKGSLALFARSPLGLRFSEMTVRQLCVLKDRTTKCCEDQRVAAELRDLSAAFQTDLDRELRQRPTAAVEQVRAEQELVRKGAAKLLAAAKDLSPDLTEATFLLAAATIAKDCDSLLAAAKHYFDESRRAHEQ